MKLHMGGLKSTEMVQRLEIYEVVLNACDYGIRSSSKLRVVLVCVALPKTGACSNGRWEC